MSHPPPLELQAKKFSLIEVGSSLVDNWQLCLRVRQLLHRIHRIAKTNGSIDRYNCLQF